MGVNGDIDVGGPELVTLTIGNRYRLGFSSTTYGHVCSEPGELVTAAELQSLTAAAVHGPKAFEAAIASSAAASTWQRSKLRAAATPGMTVQAFVAAVVAAYASWNGASLMSPWLRRS